MNIYVGNLDFKVTEQDLNELFNEFGQVESARLITDKYSGRSKGFGFVVMEDDSEANEAIEALNGKDFKGRDMTVNEARPRKENY
ncbi:MAG: RNA-binding protein [Bacteroidales bacterium]|jgi:RNA recognition motif-containing protein|nr:RNA-binding protein [Bacteroidales bacterium]